MATGAVKPGSSETVPEVVPLPLMSKVSPLSPKRAIWPLVQVVPPAALTTGPAVLNHSWPTAVPPAATSKLSVRCVGSRSIPPPATPPSSRTWKASVA